MTHIHMCGLPKASQQSIISLYSYFYLLFHHSLSISVRTSCIISWWMGKCLPCILTLKSMLLFLFKGEQVMFYSFLAETQELFNLSSSPTPPFSTLSLSSFKNYPLRACQTWLSHTQSYSAKQMFSIIDELVSNSLKSKISAFFPLSSEPYMPY